MSIKHTFVNPKTEQADPTLVGPNEWNADHSITSDVAFSGFKATGLANPISAQDAATKAYVDAGGSGGGGFISATGSFATFAVTTSATGNAIVKITNPGADSVINLVDLGSTPNTGDILVLSVLPTSTGGFAVITGGTPTGTKKTFAAASSTAPPGSAVWSVYDGAQWSPLSATPGQLLQVTNSIITQGSISAAGNITATQLLLAGALRVQACIVASNVGASASINLNSTGEGQVHRLFLNAQSAGTGSVSNITNSFVAPTGGQTLEVTNSSTFPFTLNGAAGGAGQIIFPSGLSSLVVQPGMTVFCDYDGANELGHGSNVWIVQGWTSATTVFASSGGFWGKAGAILINESSGNISTSGSLTATASIGGSALVVNGGPQISSGSLVPNANVVGSPGDLYLRTTGGAGTTLYVKESGTATNAGWVGK